MDREAFRLRLADVLEVAAAELVDEYELTGERWDSLALVGTIALIDEETGVSIPAEELEQCASVGQLLDAVTRALEKPA